MVHLVQTGAAVDARDRGTLVDVQLAVRSLETRDTEAIVRPLASQTDGPVTARHRHTLVHLLLAEVSTIPRGTEARWAVHVALQAGTAVLARLVGAACYFLQRAAVLTPPTQGAGTGVVPGPGRPATVFAGSQKAGFQQLVAGGPHVDKGLVGGGGAETEVVFL